MTLGPDLNPQFAIEINGLGIDDSLGSLITSLQYDSDEAAVDEFRITLSNPGLILSNKKSIALGNTWRVWAGFGNEFQFIGGAVIDKQRPTFPAGGAMPTVELIGCTADKRMATNSPPPEEDRLAFIEVSDVERKRERLQKKASTLIALAFSEGNTPDAAAARAEAKKLQDQANRLPQPTAQKRRKKKKSKAAKKNSGRTWPEGTAYSDVIREKAESYGFDVDVDDTPQHIVGPLGVLQRTNDDDFKFISQIANELGWLWWVSANEESGWTLHFKDPDKASDVQDFELELVYNSGDQSSLLSFDGEILLGNGPTQVQAQVWNPKEKKLVTYSVNVDQSVDSPEYVGVPDEPNYLPPNAGAEIVVAFGGVAVKTVTDRVFQTPGELKNWLDAWARAHSQDFITGRGVVRGPGIEKLSARQVHKVSGLPEPWNGRYYFTNVTHKITGAGGYEVEWSGRRINVSE